MLRCGRVLPDSVGKCGNQGKIDCGNLAVTPSLCPGMMSFHPPQAQGTKKKSCEPRPRGAKAHAQSITIKSVYDDAWVLGLWG